MCLYCSVSGCAVAMWLRNNQSATSASHTYLLKSKQALAGEVRASCSLQSFSRIDTVSSSQIILLFWSIQKLLLQRSMSWSLKTFGRSACCTSWYRLYQYRSTPQCSFLRLCAGLTVKSLSCRFQSSNDDCVILTSLTWACACFSSSQQKASKNVKDR